MSPDCFVPRLIDGPLEPVVFLMPPESFERLDLLVESGVLRVMYRGQILRG